MGRRSIVAAAALALFLTLLGAAFASYSSNLNTLQTSNGSPILGVNGIGYQSNNFSTVAKTDYNISWTRLDVFLTPYFAQQVYEPVVSSGINILGILDYDLFQPGSPFANFSSDWSLSNWTSAVSDALLAYPAIHVWEIWNEPEYYESGFLCCTSNVTQMAANYFAMLKSAYGIIKHYNVSDTVLAFGGSSISFYSGDNFVFPFSQDVWKDGASAYCDAISLHAYSDGKYLLSQTLTFVPAAFSSPPTMGRVWQSGIDAYENLTNKPIWITETGIPSNDWNSSDGIVQNTPTTQAEFLQQSLTFLSSKSYVKAIFWYNIAGISDPPFDRDFGLLNATTFAPKTAMLAFEQFESGQELATQTSSSPHTAQALSSGNISPSAKGGPSATAPITLPVYAGLVGTAIWVEFFVARKLAKP